MAFFVILTRISLRKFIDTLTRWKNNERIPFRACIVLSIALCLATVAFSQSAKPNSEGPIPAGTSTRQVPDRNGEQNQTIEEGQRPAGTRPHAPEEENAPSTDLAKRSQGAQPSTGKNSELPPEPDLEFQKFVARSVGVRLPIFGHNLFASASLTFAPLDQVSVPSEYIVGPGDELQIQTWGQIDTNFRGVVDRTGSIYLPSVGSLRVAGLRYDQLEDYLRSQIRPVYKNFQLSVSLGKLRSIRVLVVGQVRRPGTYTISSLSTIVNALFAAGGPSKRGSMRNIQLRRQGKLFGSLDLYDLIAAGDQSKDISLLPGDVIYVPPVGHLVALTGDISIPAIYELKEHTTLMDAVGYAGGMTDTTDGDRILLERIDNHHARKVESIPLNDSGTSRELHGGDVLRFFPISPKFENAVTLRGNVAVPGRYPWHEGMHVADLITSRDFLLTRHYWNAQNKLGDNASESTHDSSSTTDSADGAKERKTEITHSAAEINWNYAVIQRLDPEKLTTFLLPFNLGKAIDHDNSDNLVLQEGDVITIFSQADMPVPADERTKFVRLDGEFKDAGVYQIEKGETLRHLIKRAGGFSDQAYLYGAEFTRESARTDQQARLDEYIRGLEQTLERSAQRVSANDPQAQVRIEAQRRLIERMKELKATGRVVLQLKPESDSIEDVPNIKLEDGDRLFVPFRPGVVSVVGSVYNGSSFMYKPGQTVGNFISAAGGITKDGDKSRIFVIRADGTTIGRHSSGMMASRFAHLRMMPGDTIVVPEKLDTGAAMQGVKDWTQIFSQFALGAAAVTVFLK